MIAFPQDYISCFMWYLPNFYVWKANQPIPDIHCDPFWRHCQFACRCCFKCTSPWILKFTFQYVYCIHPRSMFYPQVITCPLKRDHFKREGSVPSITIFQGTCEYFFSSLGALVTTGTGSWSKASRQNRVNSRRLRWKRGFGVSILCSILTIMCDLSYMVCLYPIGSVYAYVPLFSYIIWLILMAHEGK